MSRDPWVLVRDEGELMVGMCVELRPCSWCGKRERVIITKLDVRGPTCEGCGSTTGPEMAGKCLPDPPCVCKAIRGRRLYRLRPDATATDETRTTKRRREVTR